MNSEVRLSCGVIPILWNNDEEPKVLLLRAYKYWDFPKGMCEEGEEPLTTALRELEEETSMGKVSFPWGKDFCETLPYGPRKVARYYVGRVKDDEIVLSKEHHEGRWMTFNEAKDLLSPRVREVLRWALRVVGKSPP